MTDSFKDAPVSLAEKRADKAANASLWTPRDALISLLREIDGGLNVEMCVISYRVKDVGDQPHQYASHYAIAGGSGIHDALGLLTRTTYLMNE